MSGDVGVDAVVVGGRAAGAATAFLLARQGLRVVVLERGRYGADTLSTHALMRGAVLQLRRWGLLDDIVAAGTPPVRWTTFTFARQRITLPVKHSHGVDALYAPRRTVLDRLLVDAAIVAGAEVRHGVSVSDVVRSPDGRVTGVVARDGRGRRIQIDAGIVIGADGVRSTVADRVDARFERVGTGASAVVYGYWEDLRTDGYEWIFSPGAQAGVIPTNGGQACVFAAATPRRIGRGGMDVLRSVVADADHDLADRLDAASAPAGVRSFGGCPGFVRRSWGPGWALVGDAGYWKDPLSAHGLTDALRDAELLAGAIGTACRGEQGEDVALAAYQARRDALSAELFATTDAIAAQNWDDDEIGDLLLRLSRSMADEVDALAALAPIPASRTDRRQI